MTPASVYFYSDRMGRIFLLAMEEILGRQERQAVLRDAGLAGERNPEHPVGLDPNIPFEQISQIQAALLARYGPAAGRGLALRTGRACLKYILREFRPDLGLMDSDFRFLPVHARLNRAAEALAGLFNRFTDQRVSLQIDRTTICWQIDRCPLCWERKSDEPCCSLDVGLLQETMYWASGGKYYLVEEKKCLACGDPGCMITIGRNPVG